MIPPPSPAYRRAGGIRTRRMDMIASQYTDKHGTPVTVGTRIRSEQGGRWWTITVTTPEYLETNMPVPFCDSNLNVQFVVHRLQWASFINSCWIAERLPTPKPYKVSYAFITECGWLHWPENASDELTVEQEGARLDLENRLKEFERSAHAAGRASMNELYETFRTIDAMPDADTSSPAVVLACYRACKANAALMLSKYAKETP